MDENTGCKNMRIPTFFKIRGKVNRIYYLKSKLYPNLISSDELISYLRYKGIEIGNKTIFFDPANTTIDIQRPWMIKIGEYCKITSGVVILAHDYSRSVLRRKYSSILCEAKETNIGDNVFIGMNSIILMGTRIGNNVIVGAGSVVSGEFPNDVVIGGNPARIICSLEKYFQKRKSSQVEEAKIYARKYYEKYKKMPSIKEMGAFFYLFIKREYNELKKYDIFTAWNGDCEKEIIESFLSSKPEFESYEHFIEAVKSDIDYNEP
jgi:acetyltransferase-like isoleucine patch superfamily enzyme